MSRRLSEMTEQSISDAGTRASKKTIDEAGFSDELKRSLKEKIAQATFKSENAAAFAQMNMPEGAGRGTRDLAAAQPWTGTEQEEDAVLRMLVDAHPPLKGGNRSPVGFSRPPLNPAPRRQAKSPTSGHRLANARDRTSIYSMANDPSLSLAERDQMRKDLKERFTPAARPMPTSVQGLASLANERIEDAIARGQFKNLPRGKIIERDYNASSPFLDTTEYFMNKIIQKQEIVPPWIEKQQELAKAVSVFRGRLRVDWKRHAARVIASAGGSLEQQVKRAQRYAEAEKAANPRTPLPHVSRLSPEVVRVLDKTDSTEEQLAAAASAVDSVSFHPTTSTDPDDTAIPESSAIDTPATPPLQPFRDPTYLATELSYHQLSIKTLNALTRTYNLMAPDLAKKPYFSLDRELQSCFADVAPLVAQEIRDRARAGVRRQEEQRHRPGGVMERFAGGEKAKVYDDRRKAYGFKEFWLDMWGNKKSPL